MNNQPRSKHSERVRSRACVGDGKAAKELSTRAHAEKKSRDEANHKAAAAIFRHQNPKGADGLRCDLHGLHKVGTNMRCLSHTLLHLLVGSALHFHDVVCCSIGQARSALTGKIVHNATGRSAASTRGIFQSNWCKTGWGTASVPGDPWCRPPLRRPPCGPQAGR